MKQIFLTSACAVWAWSDALRFGVLSRFSRNNTVQRERQTPHTGAFKAYSSWQGLTLLSQTVPELAFHFSLLAGAVAARCLARSQPAGPSGLPLFTNGFPVSTFRLRSRMPSARLTRGLVLACHVGRCVEVAACQSPRPRWDAEVGSGSLPVREAKGKWRDDNKAVVLQLCHGVGLGMNTLTVSFLLCLFQTPQGVKTGIYPVDKEGQEIGKQEDQNYEGLMTSVTTV